MTELSQHAIHDALQITYRGIDKSDALDQAIVHRATKLGQVYSDIQRCNVTVEQPHRHHSKGRHFHVKIELSIPGKTLVASRDPEQQENHADAYIAMHHAFDAMERQLLKETQKTNRN